MRRLVDSARLGAFMEALGGAARDEARVYLTGGATALLFEWRTTTADVDLKIEPESDEILRSVPAIKEQFEINVELASPGDFIPELPRWRDRSLFIAKHGPLLFHHYDLYAQSLSKLERGHVRDLADVRQMLERRLVDPQKLGEFFEAIEPLLYRFPAIDPRAFRRAVDRAIAAS